MSGDSPQGSMPYASIADQPGSHNEMPVLARVTTRLLILEDTAEDAELEERILRKAGHSLLVQRVGTRADFAAAAASFHPDLIIVDYKLPDFDGLSAVKLIRERDTQIPILLVTGALEDEKAVEVVKAGATDFVRKDRLARLPIAFAAALAAAATERERGQAVQAMHQSARAFEDLYNNAPCGYHSTNRELTIVSINDTELDWLGYQRNEIVGKMRIVDLLTPDSAAKFLQQAFPRLRATGEDRDLELEMVRKDGSKFAVAFDATATVGPDGDFVSSRTVVRDISVIKGAQRRERISSEMLRNLLYGYDVEMLLLDANLDIQFMSPAAEARFGIKLGDAGELLVSKILGRFSADGNPTIASDDFRTKASAVMQTGLPTEIEVAAEGPDRYTLRLAPYRSLERTVSGIIITSVDDSGQKREIARLMVATQETELESMRLRLILDSMAAGVIVADKDGNITQINSAAQRIQGRTTESWQMYDFKPEAWRAKQGVETRVEEWAIESGLCKSDGVTPLPRELNPLLRALRGENVGETLLYISRPNGSGKYVSVSSCPIRFTNGSISGAVVVLTDASEYVQTVESLRSAMRDVRRLLEANFYPQLAIGLDEKIADVTKAMERATGASRSRLIGSDFSRCFTEPEAARAAYRETVEKGSINDRALAIRDLSGKITDVLCDARTYCDEANAVTGVLFVARDITEQKRAESQASFAESVRQFRDGRA
ncbi:MAG: PAS domain S-box protein [Methylovirgula sp.]